jgi:hypothetical protein
MLAYDAMLYCIVLPNFSPSRRTASPLGTDLESEAYGLIVLINRMNRIPLMKQMQSIGECFYFIFGVDNI